MLIATRTSLITSLLLLLGLSACATTNSPMQGKPISSSPAVSLPADASYEVKPGDSLINIAEKLTGKASNWQLIAEHNAINDPRTLAVGNEIRIPHTLLRQVYSKGTQNPPVLDNKAKLTSSTPSTLPITTGSGFSVARGRNNETGVSDAINVTPINVNRSFSLKPLEKPLFSSIKNDNDTSTKSLRVRVVGSYFPKGLYDEPANYAKLIDRVTPGTVFELEAQVNDWYKVTSETGVAYLRVNDGVLVK